MLTYILAVLCVLLALPHVVRLGSPVRKFWRDFWLGFKLRKLKKNPAHALPWVEPVPRNQQKLQFSRVGDQVYWERPDGTVDIGRQDMEDVPIGSSQVPVAKVVARISERHLGGGRLIVEGKRK